MLVTIDRFFENARPEIRRFVGPATNGHYRGSIGNWISACLLLRGIKNPRDFVDEWWCTPGMSRSIVLAEDTAEARIRYLMNHDYRSEYGVADTVQQVLDHFKAEVEHPTRWFILAITVIRKVDQPPQGGWRWHKWGPYLGTHKKQCEYLYDERGITQVLCFHFTELLGTFWDQYAERV